jgi:16S rRNA (cytosine1402-N4)-methyltransferase
MIRTWRRLCAQLPAVEGTSSSEHSSYHTPVMLKECIENLNIQSNGVYVDCTMGGGGHTRAILEAGGRVIGLDQDSDAIAATSKRLADHISKGNLEIHQINFRHIKKVLQNSKLTKDHLVDGVLMDLGISSYQIDEASRGFSFNAAGPLDMRMGKELNSHSGGLTAADIVNTWSVDDIADVLYHYGDETRSRVIAREIVNNRPLLTTKDLVNAISKITSFKERTKTLAKCFQALRIVVNDEMNALEEALLSMQECIRPNGRLVILSYHSLEDRRVKRLMRNEWTTTSTNEQSLLQNEAKKALEGPWKPLFKKSIPPTEEEIARNSRARSAKLRVAVRIIDATMEETTSRKMDGKGGRSRKVDVKMGGSSAGRTIRR